MRFFYEIPLWLLSIVIILPIVLFSLGGVWIARSRNWVIDERSNATAGFAHAFIGVLYAVALGLMVVGVQSSYEDVEGGVVQEAKQVSDLYRNLEAMPDPARTQMQGLTSRYLDAVITKEFPAVAKDQRSEPTWRLADSLVRSIITYEPTTEHAKAVYPTVLDLANKMLDQRRERLYLGTSGVGTVTWMVVLIGALITIGVAWFFYALTPKTHYMLVGTMSAMFGLMIFLIVALDHPLWGTMSVQPEALQTVQANILRWDRERGGP
jgi:hypothetical protein